MAQLKKKQVTFKKRKVKKEPVKNKVKKESKKQNKFPIYSRFIPDWKRIDHFQLVTIIFLFVAIVSVGLDIRQRLEERNKTAFNRAKIDMEIKSWKEIANKYPEYKDAYFQIGVLNYRKQDFTEASRYINKALFLDPDYLEAQIMKTKVEK